MVQAQNAMYFHTSDRRILFPTKKNSTLIGESIWTAPLLPSYQCEACQVIVIDYMKTVIQAKTNTKGNRVEENLEEIDPFEQYYQDQKK